jgi:predicted DCC family thiol-disulfide oxidoreductase YuxK
MAVKVANPLYMLYDADCGLCSRTAQAMRMLDVRGRLRVIPLQRASAHLGGAAPPISSLLATLHVGNPADGWSTGGAAAMRLARAIPVLRTLAWAGALPGMRRLVEPGYWLLVTNRDTIGRLVGADRCTFRGDEEGAAAT